MKDREFRFVARRVVIALESGCENLNALQMAAEMAVRMKAELHGLFFEDMRLLSAAALPFIRQVSLHPAGSHPLDPADIETELRAMGLRLRRHLEEFATRLRLPWSFETVRGDRSSVISAIEDTDVLVVETATRPFAQHMCLSTDWWQIVITCDRACLLLGVPIKERKGVLAIHDGSEGGEHALAAAIAMDGSPDARLTIATTEEIMRRAGLAQRVEAAGAPSAFETVNRMDPAELLRLIRNSRCALAIVPASLAAAHRAEWQDLLAAPPCDILLVV
jgi:hypothetical protein